ncbi:PKD domain-containing protein [Candidatus Parcubacteria bacterium]|nr:PKD domain-containing protein [Candidatus Parcubacteria bacterium]
MELAKNIKKIFFGIITASLLLGGFFVADVTLADNPDPSPARLIVLKEVTNHGGNAAVSDFLLFVSDSIMVYPVTSGFLNDSFAPGPHVVFENNLPGYTGTFGGDCDAQGNVVLVAGETKLCIITNEEDSQGQAPSVSNLNTSYNGCTGIAGAGQVVFSWDVDGAQENFAFQVALAADTSFSNPIINRGVNGFAKQQSVLMRLNPDSRELRYNTSYRWQIKVCNASACSDWTVKNPYLQTGHPSAFASFVSSPGNPAVGDPVSFINTSICYNNSGQTACQSYLWDFGDGQTGTQQSPVHSYGSAGRFLVSLRTTDDTDYCQTNRSILVGPLGSSGPAWKEAAPGS